MLEPNCVNCGTRLMIVTFPSTYRHDEPHQPSYYEQFLLEKISMLEMQVSQMADSIKKLISIFEKSQQFLKTENKSAEKHTRNFEKKLSDKTSVILTKDSSTKNANAEKYFNQIINQHNGKKQDLFNQLIKDGFKFYLQNEEKQLQRTLERATEISPQNKALLIFLGKIFFEQENNQAAEKYLHIARKIAPHDFKVLLLLATVYADSEQFDMAFKCTSSIANMAESSFCLSFINAFVFIAHENWLEARSSFQKCMHIFPSAETSYLYGCILYQCKDFKLARKALEFAVKSDENFADALFMLSQNFHCQGKTTDSQKYLLKAKKAKDSRSQCFEFLNGKKVFPDTALPFIENKYFLKGSKRISDLFKSELEKALNY